MKHKHPWIFFWYHEGCPRCKVRQLRYGFRLDPEGYMRTRNAVFSDPQFSTYEKLWITTKCKPIIIEYD